MIKIAQTIFVVSFSKIYHLGPVLYQLYTSDMASELEENIIANFADDTAIVVIGFTHKEAVDKLQVAVNTICDWTSKWRIK